ncbi:MAG: hypothetical protein E7029_09685 [Planctomycetaceae bacterium]|nr:hypothetical protein [Planctomycetaceae bacterium]
METERKNVLQDPARVYLRVIDASANRACEALRVIEDFVRFVQNDAFLTETLKTLRHRLVQNVLTFSLPERLAYRETLADVGTRISTQTEFHRASLESVLDANFSRLQEALRSLEEFSKLTQPESAHEFEQIRYASYTVQRAVFFTFLAETPRRRILRKLRSIEFLSELEHSGRSPFAHDTLSVLPKGWPGEETGSQGNGVSPLARSFEFPEDGLRIVQEMKWMEDPQCDGILLRSAAPEEIHEIRNRVGSEKLIGVCIQSADDARRFLLTGIDFLAVLPQTADPAAGSPLESAFERICSLTTLPVFPADHPDFFI